MVKVAGRVADAEFTEVDDRAELAVDGQQVAGVDVAVEPDRRTVPFGGVQCRVPQLGQGRGVEHAAELRESGPRRVIPVGQRHTAHGHG
ncbi:hypothetical protein Y717_14705 [Streptomyces scopuliridis RB72]|uniref:Uncharacterized protein n=1 Tax=Streptomyces scopuliridis RB72 TaxID=1440053 RepID=A0A2T7T857_9ACTN|nr:hypothetical protein Y717_14705 [Streptomyces scopuliridis RB72]